MGLALQSSVLLVLAVGGQQVLDGTLSYGAMSSFLLYTVFLGFHAGQLSTTCAAPGPAPQAHRPRPTPPQAHHP